jgi:PIF1-like helicase
LYQDCRYISQIEASYRTLGLSMHGQKPSVERLTIHLPHRQSVHFQHNANRQEVLESMDRSEITQLTAYFQKMRNEQDPDLRTLQYQQMLSFYSWDARSKVWKKRQRQQTFPTLGRIHYASLRQGELFFLRVLLNNVGGATSFEFLRTVNGQIYPTFHAACIARGLFHDDSIWIQTMRESVSVVTYIPNLRELFATILENNRPPNIVAFWEMFRVSLSDDYIRQLSRLHPSASLQDIENSATTYALNDIRAMLNDREILNTLPSSDSDVTPLPLDGSLPEVAERHQQELADLLAFFDANLSKMNAKQQAIFQHVTAQLSRTSSQHSADSPFAKVTVVDAPGGTGKTFLAKMIVAHCHQNNKNIITSASTGIAALLLPFAKTTHKTFGVPLTADPESMCSFQSNRSPMLQTFREADLLIFDECSMYNKNTIQCIDYTARSVIGNDLPFGGKHVLFFGDGRQIPPVIQGNKREQVLAASLKSTSFFHQATWFALDINERVRNCPDPQRQEEIAAFSDYLLAVGEGRVDTIDPSAPAGTCHIPIPERMSLDPSTTQPSDLVDFVFPEISSRFPRSLLASSNNLQRFQQTSVTEEIIHYGNYVCSGAIIAPTNKVVRDINSLISSKKLPGNSKTLHSFDKVHDSSNGDDFDAAYSMEILNSITPSTDFLLTFWNFVQVIASWL